MSDQYNKKKAPIQIEVGKLYRDKTFSSNPVACVFGTYEAVDQFYNKYLYVKYFHLQHPNHILDDRSDYLEMVFEEVKDAL